MFMVVRVCCYGSGVISVIVVVVGGGGGGGGGGDERVISQIIKVRETKGS